MVIKLPRSRESTPVAVTPPSTTRALIGEESEGGSDPSLYSNPVVSIGPLFAAAAAAAARTRARRSAVSPASSSVTLLYRHVLREPSGWQYCASMFEQMWCPDHGP